ncbi:MULTISPECIES: hypothetical protein [Gammaproteobacteria]|uniref:hypothetical protein n=1 Tax=Gammaproteobacteria TaxID=1236 RepID=UPI0013DD20AA|nr:hypothetical protein [Stenotrophomonas maltophilia]MDT7156630.1 hypothetical protein [Citrobacter freundii]MDT7187081.1 hypothetical protein [Citrobacter freundii]
MRCVLALSVPVLGLLAACSDQQANNLADALATDPRQLKALRAQCAAHPQEAMKVSGDDACRAAAEAFRRRFFSGKAGPDEYQTLGDLPQIPPSFDEPADGTAPALLPGTEGTP